MIQTIQIDPRQLKAIVLLAPKQDPRNWLNGVFVEAMARETRLVAMDGQRMGVCRAEKANQLGDAICVSAILPHNVIECVKPVRGRFGVLDLRLDTERPGWAELVHGGTPFEFVRRDPCYPVYRRALGPHRGSGEPGQCDPRHLYDFHRVFLALEGKLAADRGGVYLHHNGSDNTRVSLYGREDFVGTVRPRVADGPALLFWADSPVPVARATPADVPTPDSQRAAA
ncbi:hypothetical protein Tamer19_75310 [Cupriavidus sp. TA19]|uniref:hypothetical protein n=1 Tax=Cupriavidus sp. TA19 TaxID=701108 RepID=UPI0027294A54|nr:hypothetical protein [Cupriavidus sp. TA19]GLC98122.1 hypothetical protein Tamer19_75310 [Cupriavidus sp. TA19]